VAEQKKRPVVFLDRDGTLNEEIGYIRNLTDLVLIKGAAAAVKQLNEAGVAVVLVTNQTGAARGYYAEEHIHRLNERLVNLLQEEGAHLDAVYYCPHLPEAPVADYKMDCACRKPAIGMVEQALREHPDFDGSLAYVVGDKSTDVELAANCQAKGILVETGYGQKVLSGTYQWPVKADFVAGDIVQAASWILADLKASSSLAK